MAKKNDWTALIDAELQATAGKDKTPTKNDWTALIDAELRKKTNVARAEETKVNTIEEPEEDRQRFALEMAMANFNTKMDQLGRDLGNIDRGIATYKTSIPEKPKVKVAEDPEEEFATRKKEEAWKRATRNAIEAHIKSQDEYFDTLLGDALTDKIAYAQEKLAGHNRFAKPYSNVQDMPSAMQEAEIANAKRFAKASYWELPQKSEWEANRIVNEYIKATPELEPERDQLTQYVARKISGVVHNDLMQNDTNYFATAFEDATGMSYESFLKDRAEEIKKRVKALKIEAEKTGYDEAHARSINDLMHNNIQGDLRIPALEAKAGEKLASMPYEELLEKIEAWEKNSFASGFKSGFDAIDFFSLGLADMLNSSNINSVLDKAYKGETLYGNDKRLYELWQLQNEIESYRDIIYDKQGLWSSIGEGVGTSAEMLPEFAVSMAGTGGVASFAKLGGKAALKSALKAGGKELAGYALKTTGKLAYNYGLAKVRGAIASPFMTSTYNQYFQNLNSGYKIDEDGELKYEPIDKSKAYFGAMISTANEISSEYIGLGFSKVIGMGARNVGRAVGNTKLSQLTKPLTRWLPRLSPQAKKAMLTVGVQADPISEALSEGWGDIMTAYEQSLLGLKVDAEQFATFDYWATLFGVSLVYGGALSTVGGAITYKQVKDAVAQRDKIVGEISNRALQDQLLAITAADDVMLESSALADIDWGSINDERDLSLASAFIVADLNVKILTGAAEEDARLQNFQGTIEEMRGFVYQESVGEYEDLIQEAELEDGTKVYVINGLDADNATGLLAVVDATTGEKSSVAIDKVSLGNTYTVDEYILNAYQEQFSLELEEKRVVDIRTKALEMSNPTKKDVGRVASMLNINLPKIGDTVMLSNGAMAVVSEELSPAEYAVKTVDGATYKVHFTDILSTDAITAKAQSNIANGTTIELATPETTTEDITQEESISEDVTPEETISEEIATEETPNNSTKVTIGGREGTIVGTNADGSMYLVAFDNNGIEDTEAYTKEEIEAAMGTTTAPHGENTITEVATTEDGQVDTDKLPASEAAKAIVEKTGSIEVAIEGVKEVMADVAEERKAASKAQKKTSLNDIGKTSEEVQALDAQLAHHGEVLAELEKMLAEQTSQAEAKTTTPSESIANAEATPAETKNTPEAKPEPIGLIRNETAMKFTDKILNLVDTIGKRLGLTIEFVDNLTDANGQLVNGDIVGKKIRLSATSHKGIRFIIGHEFFHRIKDIVTPEQYAQFVDSVKEFIGEEQWGKALEYRRRVYRNHNAKIVKEALAEKSDEEIIEIAESIGINVDDVSPKDLVQLIINTAVDKVVTKPNSGVEITVETPSKPSSLLPSLIVLTEELCVEETVADFAGEMVDKTDVFTDYAESISTNSSLLRALRKAIRSVKEFFKSQGYTDNQKKLAKMENTLTALLSEAVATEANGKTNKDAGADRKSITEEEYNTQTEKIFTTAKEKFGTTYDMREAGWILPDGSMLDFSGKHEVRGANNSFLNGGRTVDHRGISDIAYDYDDNPTGVETDLGDFLDRGAIRIDYNVGAINLNVAPTKEQRDRLKRLIERNGGDVTIDFGKGWDTEHYAEYEGARASRVLGDIDRYYDEGIKPEGNVRFSLQTINELNDALTEYNTTSDITSFVDAVRVANDKFGKHPYITNLIMGYEEDSDADAFAEKIKGVIGEANEDYAPYTAGGVRYSIVTDQIENLFNEAVAGNLTGESIAIGELTKEGKDYLEKLSGLKFKDKVSFTLNPSDLVHIHNDHFGGNEKDKGNNIPLTTLDIKRIVDVISFPTAIMYGKEKNSGRNLFYFLMDTGVGTYNLLEVYSDRKGNLSTKTYYKTKKDAAQRVMELKSSLLPTSETYSGAILSDTKVPQIFELPKVSAQFSLITPEMDADYLSAVERGDMATAQQMVMEAAKLAGYVSPIDYQGSLAFNGAAPMANDYSETKEERKEAWDNGDYEGTMSLGDYADNAIDTNDLKWQLTDKGNYRRAEDYTRESIDNINESIKNGTHKIVIYRAVPTAVEENAVRNGDWVTPSRKYAEYHIGLQDWESGRVIEQEVDIDNIWWNGDDINEWGYDDGYNYGYRNTPNNRKLLDPVTYDDNGNVIPLSERFNPDKEDIRYSVQTPTFYSNAEFAVRGIKQEKATPEQWLKMIEKAGGLKAGEDKWLGLSDWLKASDKKTLSKDEVLQYIADNNFVIEEVEYSDVERFTDRDIYDTDEFTDLLSSLQIYDEDDNASFNIEEYNRLRESNADFEEGFSLDYWGESLDVKDPVAAARYLGLTEGETIHGTRLAYTTTGLENKREIALVVPSIEPYNQSDEIHFGDAGDGRAVVWIRFGETTDAEGKRVLVLDEIQSKRHQDGREKGYKDETAYKREKAGLDEQEAELFQRRQQLIKKLDEKYGSFENYLKSETHGWRTGLYPNEEVMTPEEIAEYNATDLESNIIPAARELKEKYLEGIPSAPFEKNWAELAMKRMLRYAAENGFDKVAWTTGEQQAERYNIGNVVSRVLSYPFEGNTKVVINLQNDSLLKMTVNSEGVVEKSNNGTEGQSLADVVGKELANKIMNGEGETATVYDGGDIEAKEISGDGLRIGGEGMKGFYDQMLPSFINKYGKKWGVKVGEVTMPDLEENNTMHSVDVTDAMRESVMQGQPRFSLSEDIDDALYERATQILKLCNKANAAYGINSTILVAATREDFVNAQLEAGYTQPDEAALAAYLDDDDVILLNSVKINTQEELAETLAHENAHSITHAPDMWNRLFVIHDSLNSDDIREIQEKFLPDYEEETTQSILDEIISNFVAYLSTKKVNEVYLLRGFLLGNENATIDVLVNAVRDAALAKFGDKYTYIVDALLPLFEDNLKAQKERYERQDTTRPYNFIRHTRRSTKPSYYRGGLDIRENLGASVEREIDRRGQKEGTSNSTEAVDSRYSIPDPDPSEAFYDDMPIYDEQGNEIDITTLSSEEAKAILDSKVRQMLEAEYNHNVVTIRREANEARAAINARYREEKIKRRDGHNAAHTNAAKIDELFGDKPFESLPYEVQALILIATGQAKIYWSDRGTNRGLASELGLTGSKGDRHAYRNIWGGAKKSFNEVVHEWWESIGGQESGIDDNDLRNALISALQSVQSSKDAMQELINNYDDLAIERDRNLAETDLYEEQELRKAKDAYEHYSANFELSEGEERKAYHNRAAQYFGNQSLFITDEILENLSAEIERNKIEIERLKAENKDMYTLLAEGIAKSKEIIFHALERLRMFAGMEEVDLNDVARLINMVKSARSQRQVEILSSQAQNLVQRVSIKKAKTNLGRLLSLKLSNPDIIRRVLQNTEAWPQQERESMLKHLWKVSRNGLRVSKAVHPDTRAIIDELRDIVNRYKKGDEVERAKILHEMEVRIDPNIDPIDKEREFKDWAEENKQTAFILFQAYSEVLEKDLAFKVASSKVSDMMKDGVKGSALAEAIEDKRVKGQEYLNALTLLNLNLESLIVNGKEDIRAFYTNKEEHAKEIRKMGIEAVGGEKARLLPDVNPEGKAKAISALQKVNALKNATVNAPYWTFDTVLTKIDRAGKNGKFYKFFMNKWQNSNTEFLNRQRKHAERIAQEMRDCFPNIGKRKSAYNLITKITRKADETLLPTTVTYKNNDGKIETQKLTISSGMYTIAMWRQPRYRAVMEAHGITQATIDPIYMEISEIDAGYIKFMDWVNFTLLPDTRLEYDVVHRALYGGSMAKEVNYFPANVLHYEEVKLDEKTGLGNISLSPSALKERTSINAMPNLTMNYFKVLEAHLQNMDEWASFEELRVDLSTLLSSKEFKNRLIALQPGIHADGTGAGGLYDNFFKVSKIATGLYQTDYNKVQSWILKAQKNWVAANIAYRFWTGLKQLSSIPIFAFYQANDPKSYLYFAKALAKGINPFGSVKRAMNLSPSMRQRWESRFAGLDSLMRETNKEKEIAVYRGLGKRTWNAVTDFVDFLSRFGMGFNAIMDVMACAVGVNMIYDYEINKATEGKREATEEEKRDAIRKAEYAFNSTQQSSEAAYMSAMQLEPTLAMYTAYKNASMAAHRKRSAGLEELWDIVTSKEYREFLREELGEDGVKIARGTAISDILQGFISDVGFTFMGTYGGMLLFSLLFDRNDDDDDDDREEYWDNFIHDAHLSMLNGYAFGGLAGEIWGSGTVTFNPALDELKQKIERIADNKGNALLDTTRLLFQFGLGVDLKTFYNIAAGLENRFFEEEDGDYAGAWLKALNAPQGYLKAFVGDRRDGETAEEYMVRIVRLNSMLTDIKYSDYFDEEGRYIGDDAPSFGMTKKQAQNLRREYEAAYAKNILIRKDGIEAYNSYVEATKKHAQICELLGFNPHTTPSDEKAEQSDMHWEMAYYQEDIADIIKDRKEWIGDDDYYHTLLKDEQEAMNEFINSYYEYIKQSGLGAY